MCKAIEDMKQESREEGILQGMREGMIKGILEGTRKSNFSSILNLIQKEGWSFDKAVSVLQIPKVDINYYKERLNQLN